MSTEEFEIEPVFHQSARRNPWTAEVTVRETGRHFLTTYSVGSRATAIATAERMIDDAIKLQQERLAQ